MNNDVLRIKKIVKENNIIRYEVEYGSTWNKYINKEEMFAKYPCVIEEVPDSIAIIPLICNLLPIIWIFDLKIELTEIDELFYNSIPNIKRGYIMMYKNIIFKGLLSAEKLINNDNYSSNKNAVLFSGGVDAFNTLICNINKKPDLITIFGADIELNDNIGISKVNQLNNYTAQLLGLNYNAIYSNFREVINYKELSHYVYKVGEYEWWHDFQHGIALLGLTAPLSYINNYTKVYIASSFTTQDVGNYTCASDPTIDNFFKHSGSITIHDGFNYNRQDKIVNICNYVKSNNLKIRLRVCWINEGGDNCCSCEKCYRTIMGIIAAGGNPKDYGFEKFDANKHQMIKFLKKNLKYDMRNGNSVNYLPIQNYVINNKIELPDDFKWFKDYDIAIVKPKKVYYFKNKIINKINRILKKSK